MNESEKQLFKKGLKVAVIIFTIGFIAGGVLIGMVSWYLTSNYYIQTAIDKNVGEYYINGNKKKFRYINFNNTKNKE